MLLGLCSTLALAGAPAPTVVERAPAPPTRLVVRPPPPPVAVVVVRDGLASADEADEDEADEEVPLRDAAGTIPSEADEARAAAEAVPDASEEPDRVRSWGIEPSTPDGRAGRPEAPSRRAEALRREEPVAPVTATRAPAEPAEDAAPEALDLLRNSVNEPLQPLSRSQHRWLKPTRGKFDPNPYQQIDFTAYTLEFGEVKVGLAAITVGVAPRVQLGTVPVENALGIYNLHAKANLLRIKGFDLAVRSAVHHLPLGEFRGTYLDVGGLASQQLHERFSVHLGGAYTTMSARGVPDLTKASPLITAVAGDLSAYNPPPEWFGEQAPGVRAEALAVRAAMDLRLNRRDSFVLQGQALLRAAVVTELGDVQLSEVLPPIAGLDEALSYQGQFALTEAFIASIAYQASWKQVDLRIGVGTSSVPGAWVLQANELSYRFGGKTRRTETRARKGWRNNKRDVAPPTEPVEPPPLPEPEPGQGA